MKMLLIPHDVSCIGVGCGGQGTSRERLGRCQVSVNLLDGENGTLEKYVKDLSGFELQAKEFRDERKPMKATLE